MKRNGSIALLLVLLGDLGACGGGSPPAATPSGEDAKPAEPATAATPAASASAAPPAASVSASAAPSAAPATAPTVIMSLSSSSRPAEPPPAEPVGEEAPPPPLSTTQKGFLHAQLAGTEIVFVTVADAGATCATLSSTKPSKGDHRVEVRLPWLTGYYDFSGRSSSAKFAQYQGTFWQKIDAPKGGVQVRAAPTAQGSAGRIHLKAQRPGESADLELDVAVCTAVDLTPRKPRK